MKGTPLVDLTEKQRDAMQLRTAAQNDLAEARRVLGHVKTRLWRRNKKRAEPQFKFKENERRERLHKELNAKTRNAATRLWTRWTEEEDAFLCDNCDSMTFCKIAEALSRTYRAIKGRVRVLRTTGRLKPST